MPSLFSRIIQGEIPCHKVWEDADHLAFLDIRPFSSGHTLVVPKIEHDYLFDLDTRNSEALWRAAHHVARLLKSKLGCVRVVVMVLGYEIPHTHIHLIPTHREADVLPPTPSETNHSELAALALKIREMRDEEGVATQTQSEPSALLTPNTSEVETRWDEFAPCFVSKIEPLTLRAARAGIDHLQLIGVRRVLEVGCGGGGAGVELYHRWRAARRGDGGDLTSPEETSPEETSPEETSPKDQLILSDISSEMITLAQKRVDDEGLNELIKVIKADAQALPFDDHSFDRVFSSLNLMLVPDPLAAVRETYRVLTTDGIAVWIVWGRAEHSPMMTLIPQAMKAAGVQTPPVARSNFHLGGLNAMRDLLERSSFTQHRSWYHQMVSDVETGEEFAEMILNEHPSVINAINSEEESGSLRVELSRRAQSHLNKGEPMSLDVLIVVARKTSSPS